MKWGSIESYLTYRIIRYNVNGCIQRAIDKQSITTLLRQLLFFSERERDDINANKVVKIKVIKVFDKVDKISV